MIKSIADILKEITRSFKDDLEVEIVPGYDGEPDLDLKNFGLFSIPLELLMDSVANQMDRASSEDRDKIMTTFSGLYVSALVAYVCNSAREHENHDCEHEYPKDMLDNTFSKINAAIYEDVKETCKLNDITYEKEINDEQT